MEKQLFVLGDTISPLFNKTAPLFDAPHKDLFTIHLILKAGRVKADYLERTLRNYL